MNHLFDEILALLEDMRREFPRVRAAGNHDAADFLQLLERRTGILVEYDETMKIFSTPSDERTENYITGRFG